MNTPHKHAEVIKAWADGAEIEMQFMDGSWSSVDPQWATYSEYRVKPAPPGKVYPRNAMAHQAMFDVYADKCRELGHTMISAASAALNEVANAALRHAIDAGQVVPFQEFKAAGDSWGECIRNRKSRDLAIAEAVHAACQNARFTIPGFDGIDLTAIISTVKE